MKGESPLYLVHFPSLGLYVYSSTKEIMTAAFKQIPAQFPKYEVIDVKEGELLRISPDGKITRSSYTVPEMGVRVKILDIPTTLTDFPPDQLWIQDMVTAILIEVLGSIAENERMKIRARQREGIEAAKKKNVRFGRPPKTLPENWREVMAAVKRGEMRPVDAMRILGISRSSFYRLFRSTLQ